MIIIICLVLTIMNGEGHPVIKLVLPQVKVLSKQMKNLNQKKKAKIHKIKVKKIVVVSKVIAMMIR
jgi:hypothetical protein